MKEKMIRMEIKKLNDVIDLKILKGLSYRRESLRHMFLLSRLSDMHRLPKFNSNWFKRFANNIAMFLL
jgi:hypothetical protein